MDRNKADSELERLGEIIVNIKGIYYVGVVKDKKVPSSFKIVAHVNSKEFSEDRFPNYARPVVTLENNLKKIESLVRSNARTKINISQYFQEFQNKNYEINKSIIENLTYGIEDEYVNIENFDFIKKIIRKNMVNNIYQESLSSFENLNKDLNQNEIKSQIINIVEEQNIDIEDTLNFEVELGESVELQKSKFSRGTRIQNGTNDSPGALGGILKLHEKKDFFLISNHHVLMDKTGEIKDSGNPANLIDFIDLINGKGLAELFWSRFDRKYDIALAKILDSDRVSKNCNDCKKTIKRNIIKPKIGMNVKRCSKVDSDQGTIFSDNAWVKGSNTKIFKNQIIIKGKVSDPGHSGSLLVSFENEVVGIIVGGDNSNFSFASPLYDLFKDENGDSKEITHTVRYNELFKNKNGAFKFDFFV